ncbi:MAG: DUF222 domain-containing protein, partial [Streptosporangiaceae bacterium]|nr:DUF222 domain-containing protein [Streptosporangiaceae bacterium]
MPQEPVSGHGRDEDPSAAPRGPVPGFPGGSAGVAARAAGGYAAFEQGCALDGEIASAVMGVVLDELAGPHRRPAGASDDAVLGMLGGFDKLSAWCEAGKLGLIRELIRRHPQPGLEGRGPGGLPGAWARGLAQQISAELAISARAAGKLLDTAHALARLPETAHALDTGAISGHKASIIAEATGPLTDTQAAEADRRAAPKLAGKAPGEVREIIHRIVIAVDPDGARRRREQAQREHARVEFWQDAANGTANLAGFALPTDEGLMCNQAIQDRALAYKKARVFPGHPMDLLRIRAYIDLLLGRDARDAMTAPADGRRAQPDAEAGNGGGQSEDGNSGSGNGGSGTGEDDPAGGAPAG